MNRCVETPFSTSKYKLLISRVVISKREGDIQREGIGEKKYERALGQPTVCKWTKWSQVKVIVLPKKATQLAVKAGRTDKN